jgi:hypothetical protein
MSGAQLGLTLLDIFCSRAFLDSCIQCTPEPMTVARLALPSKPRFTLLQHLSVCCLLCLLRRFVSLLMTPDCLQSSRNQGSPAPVAL